MRLRNGYKNDIELFDAFISFLIVTVIFTAIYAFVFWMFYSIRSEEISSAEKKNHIIDQYNNMSIDDRKSVNELLLAMEHYLAVKPIDPDSSESVEVEGDLFLDTLPYVDILKPAIEVWWIYWWPVWWCLLVVIYFFIFLYYYFENMDRAYPLVDLPWSSWKLYFYLPALICIFPAFIVSYVKMKRNLRTLNEWDRIESSKAKIPDKLTMSARFKNDFVLFCMKYGSIAQYKKDLELAKMNLESRMRELISLGESVKGKQRVVAEAKQEVELLEDNAPTEEMDKQEALRKLEILNTVRGVMDLSVSGEKIIVTVAVRVEYKKKLYDFGDWRLTFGVREFTAKVLRRGTRSTWTVGNYPDYSYSNGGFCFGGRANEIQDHLNRYNYVEAIVVSIDCLHSVNNESDRAKIPVAFREIPIVLKSTARKKKSENKYKSKSKKKKRRGSRK